MAKPEAVNKGWLSNMLKRYFKKPGSELVVDRNFNGEEASSKALKIYVGFFYTSKFRYNGKFKWKELGNYRITYVFSLLAHKAFKK